MPGNGAEERCGLAFYFFFSLFPLHLAESLARDGLRASTSPPAPCPSPFPPTPPFLFFMCPNGMKDSCTWVLAHEAVQRVRFGCAAFRLPAFLSLHEEPGERVGCWGGPCFPAGGRKTGLPPG